MIQPTNEAETIELFTWAVLRLGWRIAYLQRAFPDAIIENSSGQKLVAEFEYKSRNFRYHGHDPAGCNLIICWRNNWADAPLPVWALLNDSRLRDVQKCFGNKNPDNHATTKSHTNKKAYSFHVNLDKDQDIVAWLDKPSRNRSSALRALIHQDIEGKTAQPSPWTEVLQAINRMERKLEQGAWKTGAAQMGAEEPPSITAALDELGILFQ